jgi:hypothetical protein
VSISFLLDQNPNVASVGLDSAGGRTRAKGSLWRRSVELRASGAASEVTRDPGDPMLTAEQLEREIFSRKHSDYRIDTQRSGRVWPSKPVNQ